MMPVSQAADFNPIRAYWQQHEAIFVLQGAAFVDYSCEGLERKVQDLLRAAGARADMQVRAEGCLPAKDYVHNTVIYVRLHFHALLPPPKQEMPATDPDTVEEAAAAEREALRRRSFPAARIQTRLVWRDAHPVERGDCELLQVFSERVMPYIPHRVTERVPCDPEAPAGPQLQVLAPAPGTVQPQP